MKSRRVCNSYEFVFTCGHWRVRKLLQVHIPPFIPLFPFVSAILLERRGNETSERDTADEYKSQLNYVMSVESYFLSVILGAGTPCSPPNPCSRMIQCLRSRIARCHTNLSCYDSGYAYSWAVDSRVSAKVRYQPMDHYTKGYFVYTLPMPLEDIPSHCIIYFAELSPSSFSKDLLRKIG